MGGEATSSDAPGQPCLPACPLACHWSGQIRTAEGWCPKAPARRFPGCWLAASLPPSLAFVCAWLALLTRRQRLRTLRRASRRKDPTRGQADRRSGAPFLPTSPRAPSLARWPFPLHPSLFPNRCLSASLLLPVSPVGARHRRTTGLEGVPVRPSSPTPGSAQESRSKQICPIFSRVPLQRRGARHLLGVLGSIVLRL